MGFLAILFTFFEGILTFISPCILPMLPIYYLYLAGDSEDGNGEGNKNSRIVLNSLGFIIGFTIVFLLLGLTATVLGQFLKANISIFREASGVIMIVFGLNFMGVFKFKLLNREKKIDYRFKELKFISSIVFGLVFGFGWSPCTGPLLGTAIVMAGNAATFADGLFMILAYSIGLGVPFFITSIAFDNLKGSLKLLQRHNRIISVISGIVLIVAGILVITDYLKYISFGFSL